MHFAKIDGMSEALVDRVKKQRPDDLAARLASEQRDHSARVENVSQRLSWLWPK